jgi:hypothetical protein
MKESGESIPWMTPMPECGAVSIQLSIEVGDGVLLSVVERWGVETWYRLLEALVMGGAVAQYWGEQDRLPSTWCGIDLCNTEFSGQRWDRK